MSNAEIDSTIVKKNIVVTGSRGFVASHLILALAEMGHDILCIGRHERRLERIFEGQKIEYINASIDNFASIAADLIAFNPHIIYHLASQSDAEESFEHAVKCIKSNINATLNLLEIFSQCNNSEVFVYGDSVKVYGDSLEPYSSLTNIHPNSSYAIGKFAGWGFCELYGTQHSFNAISVRPTLIFGPNQPYNLIHHIIKCIINDEEEVTLMGGEQTRSPLYIDDAVNAYIKASEIAQNEHGLVMNIGGKKEMKVIEIANLIKRLMKSDIKIIKSSNKQRKNEIISSSVNLKEVYALFNWFPKYTINIALKKTIESYLTTEHVN